MAQQLHGSAADCQYFSTDLVKKQSVIRCSCCEHESRCFHFVQCRSVKPEFQLFIKYLANQPTSVRPFVNLFHPV